MDSSWRPPKWENPHDARFEAYDKPPITSETVVSLRQIGAERRAFEAGASAIVVPAYEQGQRDLAQGFLAFLDPNLDVEYALWLREKGVL